MGAGRFWLGESLMTSMFPSRAKLVPLGEFFKSCGSIFGERSRRRFLEQQRVQLCRVVAGEQYRSHRRALPTPSGARSVCRCPITPVEFQSSLVYPMQRNDARLHERQLTSRSTVGVSYDCIFAIAAAPYLGISATLHQALNGKIIKLPWEIFSSSGSFWSCLRRVISLWWVLVTQNYRMLTLGITLEKIVALDSP